jgi:hypothetical protein
MSEERHNESFHWKNKLDELHHLPEGNVFDKTAAWEKLHVRLGARVRNKMVLWYWSAAACLLLVLGSQWPRIKQDTTVLHNSDSQKQDKSFDSKTTISGNKDSGFAVETSTKKGYVIRKESPKAFPKKQKITIVEDTVTEKTSARNEFLLDTSSRTIEQRDTAALAITSPVKKKLRVVHINELGRPLREEDNFARNNTAPAFSPRAFNDKVFPGFTGSRNASDDILKIKLSPSN